MLRFLIFADFLSFMPNKAKNSTFYHIFQLLTLLSKNTIDIYRHSFGGYLGINFFIFIQNVGFRIIPYFCVFLQKFCNVENSGL